MISFCTTCFNRLPQLRQTFEANARAVTEDSQVEWQIVGFDTGSELDEFMRGNLSEACERVIYLKETSGWPWHLSVAKNVAHRQARGEILVNVDCDNFIGDAIQMVRRHFAEGYKLVHMWTGQRGDGTCGRIAIDRQTFYALGGYDESFYPMGYQDLDLIRRARAAGVPVVRVPCDSNLAIKNTKDESIRHCRQGGMSWEDYNRLNRERSIANVAAGRLVANQPHGWAPMKIERFMVPGTTENAVFVAKPNQAPSANSLPVEANRPPRSVFSQILKSLGLKQAAAAPSDARHHAPSRGRTVLVAWELGRGMGHINRLLPIATRLSAGGYRVVFAFRSTEDVGRVAGMLPGTDILQAPVYRSADANGSPGKGLVYNYADILFRRGYHSAASLLDLVRQWHELFATVGPDLILCDHSPTTLLAAEGRIPTLHIGSGFANPPAGKPLLTLARESADGATRREAEVLTSISHVRQSLGGVVPRCVADLFSWADVFVTCLPELDPYRSVRERRAVGPVQTLPTVLPPGERSFVFGYLAGQDRRVHGLLGSLIAAKIPCCMYIRQAPPEWEAMVEGTSVKLFDVPQKLPDALIAASAVLHHGGLSTTELALAAGRPQFFLPRYLEQDLTANAVERMGCGINLARQAGVAADIIRHALKRDKFQRASQRAAANIDRETAGGVGDKIVQRCLEHLAR